MLGTHHHRQGRAFFSTEAALCKNNYYFKINRVTETIWIRYHHAQECIQCCVLNRIMSMCMSNVLFWISPSHFLWPPSSVNKISGKDCIYHTQLSSVHIWLDCDTHFLAEHIIQEIYHENSFTVDLTVQFAVQDRRYLFLSIINTYSILLILPVSTIPTTSSLL